MQSLSKYTKSTVVNDMLRSFELENNHENTEEQENNPFDQLLQSNAWITSYLKHLSRLSYSARGYTLSLCPRIHRNGFIKIEFVRLVENESDYLRRTLIRSCMQNTRRNFWKTMEFTVPVDRYRIGRVLELSFAINNLVLHV
jgi:hypothetical protein